MVTVIQILYLSPDRRGVVLLAAQGHEHAIVVGAVSLEDVVRVLTVYQGHCGLDIIRGHILKNSREIVYYPTSELWKYSGDLKSDHLKSGNI